MRCHFFHNAPTWTSIDASADALSIPDYLHLFIAWYVLMFILHYSTVFPIISDLPFLQVLAAMNLP
jgi:hypothetical protein